MTTTTKHLTLTMGVKDGKLNPSETQKQIIGTYLKSREGKPVEVRIAPPPNSRSLRQNRYYWGVALGTIAAETGNTTEDLHLILKDLLLPKKFIQLGGKEVEVRKSTADLSPAEFAAYLERVSAWAAAELGIEIPPANGV